MSLVCVCDDDDVDRDFASVLLALLYLSSPSLHLCVRVCECVCVRVCE